MSKLRIMTDSASDISPEQAEKYGITLLNFWIVLGDDTFKEHEKYTTREFYKLLEESEEMPHTSQVTVIDYLEAYEKEYASGVTELINVVIASIGSNSFNNANMARNEFYEKHPEASDKLSIDVIDSKGYTGVYGFPVIEAAKKIKRGANAAEVISFLNDWFDSGVIVCTAYTLKYAKKSGRVGCAAAFVGEVLGLKPIITFEDAVSKTIAKVRGEKNVIPQLVDYAIKSMIPATPYAILCGSRDDCTEEVVKLMKKSAGYEATEILDVGATISCHLGCQVSGIVVKGANRRI